jgi:hypothetical protein
MSTLIPPAFRSPSARGMPHTIIPLRGRNFPASNPLLTIGSQLSERRRMSVSLNAPSPLIAKLLFQLATPAIIERRPVASSVPSASRLLLMPGCLLRDYDGRHPGSKRCVVWELVHSVE